MDELVKFLHGAHWQQRGRSAYICVDLGLEAIWIIVAGELPIRLRATDCRLGKQQVFARGLELKGDILAVHVLGG